MPAQAPKPGIYRHFKGNLYELVAIAHHSETREDMAVYRALYGERDLWVRPLAMWLETVTRDGVTAPRFAYVGTSEAEALGYTVTRSARKTLTIRVNRDQSVQVLAPLVATDEEIAEFVSDNAEWIAKHRQLQARYNETEPKITPDSRAACEARARAYLPERVAHFARLMGVSPAGISVTDAQKRFGSCSGKNHLCFPWRLMLYPDAAIDYVIVHELAHIRQKNHSAAFYALIAQVLPDYKERERLLNPE